MVSDQEVVTNYIQALRERWMKAIQNDQEWDCKVQVTDTSGVPDGGGYKFLLTINAGRPNPGGEVHIQSVQNFESDPIIVETYEDMFKQAKRFQGFTNEDEIQEFWNQHLRENPDLASQFPPK